MMSDDEKDEDDDSNNNSNNTKSNVVGKTSLGGLGVGVRKNHSEKQRENDDDDDDVEVTASNVVTTTDVVRWSPTKISTVLPTRDNNIQKVIKASMKEYQWDHDVMQQNQLVAYDQDWATKLLSYTRCYMSPNTLLLVQRLKISIQLDQVAIACTDNNRSSDGVTSSSSSSSSHSAIVHSNPMMVRHRP
jgi:hypothetical protein